MGILFSLIGMLSFSAFYLALDFSQRRKAVPPGLNPTTLAAGTLLSVVAGGGIRTGQLPRALLPIGSLIGITVGFGLLGIILTVRSGRSVSVADTAVSLPLTLSILLAVVLHGETSRFRNGSGLAFAAASIYLIQGNRQ